MYRRILVAIDATPTEENRSALTRTEQIGRLTGATVHVLHVARGHVVSGDIIGGAGLGVPAAVEDVEDADLQAVQALVDRLAAAGIDAHGEMVSEAEHDVANLILQRARELDVDLLILGHQHHRGAGKLFHSSVAEQVIRQHRRSRSFWPDPRLPAESPFSPVDLTHPRQVWDCARLSGSPISPSPTKPQPCGWRCRRDRGDAGILRKRAG